LLLIFLLLTGCQSWDLSDPDLRQSLVQPINEGNFLIKLDDEDIPYLVEMLRDSDPQTRLAALHLAEYNLRESLFTPILEAALDEYSQVSDEALAILLRFSDYFFPWAVNNLNQLDYEILLPTLGLISQENYVQAWPAVKELFWQESKAVNRLAAQTMAQLTYSDDEILEEMRVSEDPVARKAYYQTLYYFDNPDLIPRIIEGLDDSNPQVWGMCVTLLYNYGKRVIPYLQQQLEKKEYRLSLAVMQILEKIRIPEGIPLLIELSGSEYQTISQRSAIQLQVYGSEVFPFFMDAIPKASETQLRGFLWVLDHLEEPEKIAAYSAIIDRNISWATQQALEGLGAFGMDAWEQIRPKILTGGTPMNYQILQFLRNQGDPQLIVDLSGNLQKDYAYFLILSSTTQQLTLYLDKAEIPERYSREILMIHRASEDARRWENLLQVQDNQEEEESETGEQGLSYLNIYFQWEETRIQAKEKRREARDVNQQYFENYDRELLVKSRELRAESDRLDNEAQLLKQQLESLESIDQQGKEQLDQWLEIRQNLTDIWRNLSPSFRSLGELIYRRWGVEPEELLEISRLR